MFTSLREINDYDFSNPRFNCSIESKKVLSFFLSLFLTNQEISSDSVRLFNLSLESWFFRLELVTKNILIRIYEILISFECVRIRSCVCGVMCTCLGAQDLVKCESLIDQLSINNLEKVVSIRGISPNMFRFPPYDFHRCELQPNKRII